MAIMPSVILKALGLFASVCFTAAVYGQVSQTPPQFRFERLPPTPQIRLESLPPLQESQQKRPSAPSFPDRTPELLPTPLPSPAVIHSPISSIGTAESPERTNHEEYFVFNFQGIQWRDVLERFARETHYSLQMSSIPEGTFDFVSDQAFTAKEALNVINGQLLDAGYVLLERDNTLLVHDLAVELPPNLIPVLAPADLATLSDNSIGAIHIRLSNSDAPTLGKEIELLVSAFGRVDVLSESNSMIITDVVRNLRKLDQLLLLSERDVIQRPISVVKLNYAPADKVAAAINEFFGATNTSAVPPTAMRGNAPSFDNNRVHVVPEMETQSILVNAQPRFLSAVHQFIQKLDAPPQQVVIKAMLVEVDLGALDEFGVELGVQDSILFERSIIDNLLTLTETVTNGDIQTTDQRIVSQSGNPGFAFNNQPLGNNTAINPSRFGTQGLSNFSVGRVNGDLGFGGLVLSGGSDSVNVLLRAIAAKREVSILSRPQIRTVHNKTAKIQIGQEVPVVDGVTVNAVGSANPVIRQSEAGIILEVTPRISPDGNVVVEVNAEKSSYREGPGSGVPIFTDASTGNVIEAPIKDLTKADGTVSVRDGQTIVLGGMIGNQTITVESKVPVLGDIPLLGRLFRHDLEQVQRKELLIFLTPTVLWTEAHDAHHLQQETDRIEMPCDTRNILESWQDPPLVMD